MAGVRSLLVVTKGEAMLYHLSRLIPVRMRSRYLAHRCVEGCTEHSHLANWEAVPERASWWQWRSHIFGWRTYPG